MCRKCCLLIAILLFRVFSFSNEIDTINSDSTSTSLSPSKAVLGLLKAANFLLNDGSVKPDRDALLVTNYIYKRYGVYIPYPSTDIEYNKMPLNSSNLIVYSKWYDPEYKIDKKTYEQFAHHKDSLLMACLYCDSYKLPKKYLSKLDKMSLKDGYYLTHACLYLQWSINNACINTQKKHFQQVYQNLQTRLDSFVNIPKQHWYDVDIEAIAIKSFMNENINANWIAQILNAQNDNGGWYAYENENVTSAHTTALAIWTLIDYLKDKTNTINDFDKLSAEQQFIACLLMSSIHSDSIIATPTKFFSLSPQNGKFESNSFLKFDSVYTNFQNRYKTDVSDLKINSILNNDDTLAYFVFLTFHSNFIKSKKQYYLDKLTNFINETDVSQLNQETKLKLMVLNKLLANKNVLDKSIPSIQNNFFYKFLYQYLNVQ